MTAAAYSRRDLNKSVLFFIDEQTGSITFDMRRIARKVYDLDVAQILILTEYKNETLLIGIEKDWKLYGDDKVIIKLKIGDKSGLYNLAGHSSIFDLPDPYINNTDQLPLVATMATLDSLVEQAKIHREEIRKREEVKEGL